MKIIPLVGANYLEFVKIYKRVDVAEDNVIVIETVRETEFETLLEKCQKLFGKGGERLFKEFVVGDLHYQIIPETGETTVFSLKPLGSHELGGNMLEIQYEKKKLSIINFPSTRNHHDVSNVRKLTFRLSNRVFLNFEMRSSELGSAKTYNAYVNYNHDTNVDIDTMVKDIQRGVSALGYA